MSSIHSVPSVAIGRDVAPFEQPRTIRLLPVTSVPARPSTRADMWVGIAFVVVFTAALGAWSAWAPLAAATQASGSLVVEGSRRTVQHLEGGIIREFLVRDGDRVVENQILLRLDDTQTAATAEALRVAVDGFRALDARLAAERIAADRVIFPDDLVQRRGELRVAEILAGQEAIFSSRQVALDGQSSILRQRIAQLRAEIRSYEAQMKSHDDQLFFVRAEIDDVRGLVEKGLERRPRMLALQRTAAQLVGGRDQQLGLIAKAEQTIQETELQLLQLRNARQAEITTEQRDLQTRLADVEERLRAASDVQRRRDVLAPVAGTITSLRFHTVGGVVRAGEPLLDVVPTEEGLVVEVRILPNDINSVSVEMPAEIRLTAFRQRVVPAVHGKVIYVAADVESDPRTMQSFYRAKIRIDPSQLAALEDVALAPGMPADVMISAGSRTLLQYLAQPLLDSFHRAFRER